MTRRPRTLRSAFHRPAGLLRLLPAVLAACGGDDAPRDPPPSPEGGIMGPAPGETAPGPVHDRFLVFLSVDADTTLVVPWSFRAIEGADGVLRETGVWMARGGAWEWLAADTLRTPPTRTAGRVLPGRSVRILVGEEDVIEALVFRSLESRPGELLADWSVPGGALVRLHRGRTTVPSGEVSGLVMDHARRWAPSEDRAEGWILLHAGMNMQLFLEPRAREGGDPADTRFRGWSRVAFQDQPWPELRVSWQDVRAFERARRDVPVAWRIASPDGEIEGVIRAVSSHLSAGSGEGPLLPVHAFFEVEGEVAVMGEVFGVRGLVHHVQP